MYLAIIICACKTSNSKNNPAQGDAPKSQSSKFSVNFESFECASSRCTVSSTSRVSYELAESHKTLNLVEYIPFFPDALKVEIVRHKLKLASLNDKGQLVDLYDKTILKNYSASYIVDKPTNLFILLPFKNLDDYIRDSRYAYLPVAAGSFTTDSLGRLESISDKSVFSSNNSIGFLQKYLHNIVHFPDQDTSFALLKKFPNIWQAPQAKKPVLEDISISSGSTSSMISNLESGKIPEISFKNDILNTKAQSYSFFSHRLPWSDSQEAATRKIIGNIDKRSGKEIDLTSLKNIDDDQLLFVMNYSAIKGSKNFNLIEGELTRRLKLKGHDLFFESQAFNSTGVTKLIEAYKEIYPGLKNLDIEDIPANQLSSKVTAIGPNSKKAFLVHQDGAAHRNLVYVDGNRKTIYVSDSIGLKDDAYAALNSLEGSKYTVYTHDALRQSDNYNCSIFCLMDVRKIDDPEFIKGVQDSSPLYRSGISDVIPADLLVATQSINKLRNNQEIGNFLESAKKQGKTFATVEGEFRTKFLDPLQKKFDETSAAGDYSKLQFVEGYESSLKHLYENDDLRKLYFFQKSDLDSVKTPLESASFFEEGGINTYSTVIRSMLLSRIAQRSL